MRNKEIRLSKDEKRRLTEYRESEYDPAVPYGYIIGRMLDEVTEDGD